MYLNPPINGQYELHEPLAVDASKWYVRTFDCQFNTAGHIGPPNRYAYLNRDLSFVMHPNQDFYDSREEALNVIRLYQTTCNQASTQPQEKVYKLLEPQQFVGRQDDWMVPATDDNHYLFSNGKIIHRLYISSPFGNDPLACFPSYQSALFAKLRYERLNRCKN